MGGILLARGEVRLVVVLLGCDVGAGARVVVLEAGSVWDAKNKQKKTDTTLKYCRTKHSKITDRSLYLNIRMQCGATDDRNMQVKY